MKLRQYQEQSIDAIKNWFGTQTSPPLLVLPTGSGKTVVFATLIQNLYRINPNKRFLILAHRQELISQARDKLLSVWPCAPYCIMAAGLKEFDATAPIVIASRDTLASKKRLHACEPFDLIVVDEAHHVGPDKNSRYRKILSHLEEIGDPYVMGVTATPYRMGQGMIYGMEDDHYFGGVAHQVTIPELIEQDYLCRLSAFAVADSAIIDASTARLKFKGGDYRESDLELIAMEEHTIVQIIDDWIDKAFSKGRTSTVFFCVTVAHAYKMCMYLKKSGIKAAAITAETPAKERVQILEDFESGEINALCNVAVLTEGWDAPRTDCIAILRPTKSLGLYVQICGRGMRTWGDKQDCLLLDYGENMKRHGCIDRAKPKNNRDETDDKIWICDSCLGVNDWDEQFCFECGEPKPKPEIKIEEDPVQGEGIGPDRDVAAANEAAEGYVLSDEMQEVGVKEETRKVSNVIAEATVSANGNLYCKVKFMTYDSYYPYSLSLMIGMPGKAGLAAHRKWSTLTREKGYEPDTVDEAVMLINSGVFDSIREIVVRKEGKYWNVVNANF